MSETGSLQDPTSQHEHPDTEGEQLRAPGLPDR